MRQIQKMLGRRHRIDARQVALVAIGSLIMSVGLVDRCAGQTANSTSLFVNPNQHNFEEQGPISNPGQVDRQVSWAGHSAQILTAQKLGGSVLSSREAVANSNSAIGKSLPALDKQTRPLNDVALNESTTYATSESANWSQAMQGQLRTIDWTKMVGSLVLVISGYLAIVAILRRWSPSGSAGVPKEVVEMIGIVRFDARRHLQLIRLGSKLLLVAHGPEGIANIGEIDDPHEVEYLVQQCGRNRSRSRYEPVRMPRRDKAGKATTDLTLEKLVQSLQQAIRNPTGQAEFEA